MKREAAEKWVADLRAHPELQGTGMLKTEDGKYCCLGRLCAINGYGFRHASRFPFDGALLDHHGEEIQDLNTAEIPDDLKRELDMSLEARVDVGFGERMISRDDEPLPLIEWSTSLGVASAGSLWEANDQGCPFSVIADWIEKNWERL